MKRKRDERSEESVKENADTNIRDGFRGVFVDEWNLRFYFTKRGE